MDPVQEIKNKLDIVDIVKEHIPLMSAGKNFKALCPFHKEKTPSFIVSPERQTWHCFGSCSEGGDIFSFIMKYEHVEFYEALQMLAQKAGVELKRISPQSQKEFGVLYDINVAAKDFFLQQREHEPKAAEYLHNRGIKKEILDEFEIGFASTGTDSLILHLVNAGYDIADAERAGLVFKTDRGTYMDRFRGRIMFPIKNTFGKVVGFAGRILPEYDDGKSGKYVNSPETPIFNKSRILYGLDVTKQHVRDSRVAMLVEGQMDFLMLYQDGIHNVVAISGTALTQHHLEILRKVAERLILAFDNDEAGMIAIERAIDMAHMIDMGVNIFLLDGAKDAAEYIQKNPGKIKRLIGSSSISALEFYLKRYIENIPEHELKLKIRHILEKVMVIYSPLEQNRWLKKISERTQIPESALIEELNLLKKKSTRKEEPKFQPALSQDVPLKTRIDLISMELLILGVMDLPSLPKISELKIFLPDKFANAFDYLQNTKTDDKEVEAIGRYVELRASLRYGEIDLDKIPLEVNALAYELKKEYYKERKEKILSQIKSLEKSGKTEESAKLLKEFDEIAKLVNN
jgi:DNA primase